MAISMGSSSPSSTRLRRLISSGLPANADTPLYGREAGADGIDRQHLPPALAGARQEVDERPRLLAEVAVAVRTGQAGRVQQHAAGALAEPEVGRYHFCIRCICLAVRRSGGASAREQREAERLRSVQSPRRRPPRAPHSIEVAAHPLAPTYSVARMTAVCGGTRVALRAGDRC